MYFDGHPYALALFCFCIFAAFLAMWIDDVKRDDKQQRRDERNHRRAMLSAPAPIGEK